MGALVVGVHADDGLGDFVVHVIDGGLDALDAEMLELDGTDNKGAMGANAILGASLAVRVSGAIDVARKKAEAGAPLRIAVEVSVPDAAEDSPESPALKTAGC